MAETLDLYINARHHFAVQNVGSPDALALPSAATSRIERAFSQGQGAGLVQLATSEITTPLRPGLTFARDFAQCYASFGRRA